MKGFISCDWGSTSLRTRFVDAENRTVLAEISSDQGCMVTFALWQKNGAVEQTRLLFYLNVIRDQIKILEKQSGFSFKDLVISGMATSNIGMMELPYKELPIKTDGSDLHFNMIAAPDELSRKILLVSGVKTKHDVIRGEEIQLAGCDKVNYKEEQVFIFPGTHSKHILVKDQQAIDFKTYMTGEFFSLLSRNSILAGSVEESEINLDGNILKNFEEGVANSLKHNLLRGSFLTRTNELFNRNTKKENYYWLSGLLIGTELKGLIHNKVPVTLVCNKTLKNYYFAAFNKLGMADVQFQDSLVATVNGQCNIYNHHISDVDS